MRIAIVWGSTTGRTEEAAEELQKHLGELVERTCPVLDISASEMNEYDVLIIGVSTWDIGELQYDWPERLEELAELDWTDRHVAFFGAGDAVGYADTFVDALGIVWEKLEEKGAKLLGKWPVEGYTFEDSRALCDEGKNFVGLAIDDDNEPELTEARLLMWADQLRFELHQLPKKASTS